VIAGIISGTPDFTDRDDQLGAKIKTQENPQGFRNNLKNSLDKNLTPQKSYAVLPSNKHFQKV